MIQRFLEWKMGGEPSFYFKIIFALYVLESFGGLVIIMLLTTK